MYLQEFLAKGREGGGTTYQKNVFSELGRKVARRENWEVAGKLRRGGEFKKTRKGRKKEGYIRKVTARTTKRKGGRKV